jgi:hypothetical protein
MNQALQRLAGELDANPNHRHATQPGPAANAKPKVPPNNPAAQGTVEPDPLPLPADRQKAVEYGIAQFQQVSHRADELRKEVAALRERVAALEIENEGLRAQINDAQSQVASAHLKRDQALADRIKYEGLFVSIQAQMRAFAVPATPLISDADFGSQQ